MRFRVEFSAEAERDFALIFDYLFESYLWFWESVESALIIARTALAKSGGTPIGWLQRRFASRAVTICCRACAI